MSLLRYCLALLFSLTLLTACAKKEEYAAETAAPASSSTPGMPRHDFYHLLPSQEKAGA